MNIYLVFYILSVFSISALS